MYCSLFFILIQLLDFYVSFKFRLKFRFSLKLSLPCKKEECRSQRGSLFCQAGSVCDLILSGPQGPHLYLEDIGLVSPQGLLWP